MKATATLWPPKPNELLIAGQITVWQVADLGGDVDAKIRLWVVQVDRGWHLAVTQREQGGERLQCAGATEQVTGHRLGGGDDRLGVVTERLPDRARLGDVALRRRGRVRVDVHDVAGSKIGLAQRLCHGQGLTAHRSDRAGPCRGHLR